MMETIIAIACGVIVGGGILTLVWRIMSSDRDQKKLDEGFAQLSRPVTEAGPAAPEEAKAEAAKAKQ